MTPTFCRPVQPTTTLRRPSPFAILMVKTVSRSRLRQNLIGSRRCRINCRKTRKNRSKSSECLAKATGLIRPVLFPPLRLSLHWKKTTNQIKGCPPYRNASSWSLNIHFTSVSLQPPPLSYLWSSNCSKSYAITEVECGCFEFLPNAASSSTKPSIFLLQSLFLLLQWTLAVAPKLLVLAIF